MDMSEVRKKFPQYDDLSDQKLADALHAKFYKDMPRDEFDRKIGLNKQSKASGVIDAFTQGASFGFGDELTALEAGLLGRTPDGKLFDYSQSFGQRYDDALAAERGQQEQFKENNPALSVGSEIAGGVASAGGLAKQGISLVGRTAGRPLLKRMAAGAGEGAAYGAAYGAGNADNESRLDGAAGGAMLGAGIGGAIPAVGSALRKGYQAAASKAQTSKVAPTKDALKEQAGRLFKEVDDAGVRFNKGTRQYLMDGMIDDLSAAKYRPNINKNVRDVIKEFSSFVKKEPSLTELQDYRSFILKAQRNLGPEKQADAEMLGLLVQNIDEFADKISDSMVVGSSAARQSAQSKLKQARNLWKRVRKSDIIDEALYRSENQASGVENGLRVQFRRILDNPRKRKAFTTDEIKAMEAVTRGGVTENTLKLLGKLGFGVDGASNAFGGSVGIGLGGLAGGPVGSMAVAAGATAARKGAEIATRKNAEFVSGLVRAGKVSPAQAPRILKGLEDGSLTPEAISGALAGVN